MSKLFIAALLLLATSIPGLAQAAAQPAPEEKVRAVKAPKNPIPPEDKTAGTTKFSFVVYGDTRGRRDGRELQYDHSMIVQSIVERTAKLAGTDYPIKFVLQSGDAVVNGRIAQQLNVSFVDLINRLTTEAGLPYFLAPGNHDVTSYSKIDHPERLKGLQNFYDMNANLIPGEGSPRRLAGYPVFSFGYGNSFFIALDTNIAGDEKQFDWVSKQLEGLDRKRFTNVFVYGHHPFFSSGPHGGSHAEESTKIMREKYSPLFRKHHVRVYFCGHEHFFEHWVENYESDGKKYRMDQVLTGGGGAPLYAYTGDPDIQPYVRQFANEKVSLERIAKPGATPGENAYHYVLVKVDGEKISMEVIGMDWGSTFTPYRSNKVDMNH